MWPELRTGHLTAEQRVLAHLLRARAFSGAQATLGFSLPENHKVVIADYAEAERVLGSLEPSDTSRLVESLLGVDQVDKALDRARALPASEAARRTRLFQQVVEHNLATDNHRDDLTLGLLADLSNSPDLTLETKAWVLARQTELLLNMGRAEDAVARLLREFQRLRDLTPAAAAELHVLLGKAYDKAEQRDAAMHQLELAESMLEKTSPLRADVGVLLGKIDKDRQRLGPAKQRFTSVIDEFSTSKAYPAALLGFAEVEAALASQTETDSESGAHGDFQTSLEKYAELVELIGKAKKRPEVTRTMVLSSLMLRQGERFDAGKRETALRFAMLAESLFKENEVPPDLLAALGRIHRAMAEEALQAALESTKTRESRGEPVQPAAAAFVGPQPEFSAQRASDASAAGTSVEDLDPATRAEVKRHFLSAGDYLRRYADAVSATDTAAYADSLWKAADSLDRAGDLDEARKAFSLYADGAADNDPQRPAAKFRLAQIFQAQEDYSAAAALYTQLQEQRLSPEAPQSAGIWADRSIVPMARCLLQDNDPSNDEQAEHLLLSVVDGSVVTPDAPAYREALIELGGMYYSSGKYPDAISRLEQAAERYPEDRRLDAIRYRLADSHRLEASQIDKTLSQGGQPQSARDALATAREGHLRTARALYEQVKGSLDGKEKKRLTELDKVHLRNSCFYAGDCAFELKEYDVAIAAYDAARLKYADDPASLVAMVQIVSAYVSQGQWTQAKTANERARQQLAKFPDEVWTRSDLPMEKKHWERWLDARTILEQSAQAGQ